MAESTSITTIAIGARVAVKREQNRIGGPHYPGRTGIVIRENTCGCSSGGYWYVRLDATRRAKERVELFGAGELELLAPEGMKLRIVEYVLDYQHRVQVGVPSASDEEAVDKAQAAFDAGTIWDDTQEMPLLFDDYDEVDGTPLCFKVVATVDAWPTPDHSVIQLRRQANAVEACRVLVAAVALRDQVDVLPEEIETALDQACSLARAALGDTPGLPKLVRPRVVVGVEGGLVQGASSDLPVDLVVVDYDVYARADGAVAVPQSGGGESMAAAVSHLVDLDPAFVDGVWSVI